MSTTNQVIRALIRSDQAEKELDRAFDTYTKCGDGDHRWDLLKLASIAKVVEIADRELTTALASFVSERQNRARSILQRLDNYLTFAQMTEAFNDLIDVEVALQLGIEKYYIIQNLQARAYLSILNVAAENIVNRAGCRRSVCEAIVSEFKEETASRVIHNPLVEFKQGEVSREIMSLAICNLTGFGQRAVSYELDFNRGDMYITCYSLFKKSIQ